MPHQTRHDLYTPRPHQNNNDFSTPEVSPKNFLGWDSQGNPVNCSTRKPIRRLVSLTDSSTQPQPCDLPQTGLAASGIQSSHPIIYINDIPGLHETLMKLNQRLDTIVANLNHPSRLDLDATKSFAAKGQANLCDTSLSKESHSSENASLKTTITNLRKANTALESENLILKDILKEKSNEIVALRLEFTSNQSGNEAKNDSFLQLGTVVWPPLLSESSRPSAPEVNLLDDSNSSTSPSLEACNAENVATGSTLLHSLEQSVKCQPLAMQTVVNQSSMDYIGALHSSATQEADGFKVVSRKRKPRSKPTVLGACSGSNIIGVIRPQRKVHLFVTRCSLSTTPATIENHLCSHDIKEAKCTSVKLHHDKFVAFRVSVPVAYKDSALKPSLWGIGVEVRHFKFSRPKGPDTEKRKGAPPPQ